MSSEETNNNEAIDALQLLSETSEEREYDTFWLDLGQIIVPVVFLLCCLAVMYLRGTFDKPAGGRASSKSFMTGRGLSKNRIHYDSYLVEVTMPSNERINVYRLFSNKKLSKVKVIRGGKDSQWFIFDVNTEKSYFCERGQNAREDKFEEIVAKSFENMSEDEAKRVFFGLWDCGIDEDELIFEGEGKLNNPSNVVMLYKGAKIWINTEKGLPWKERRDGKVWIYTYSMHNKVPEENFKFSVVPSTPSNPVLEGLHNRGV